MKVMREGVEIVDGESPDIVLLVKTFERCAKTTLEFCFIGNGVGNILFAKAMECASIEETSPGKGTNAHALSHCNGAAVFCSEVEVVETDARTCKGVRSVKSFELTLCGACDKFCRKCRCDRKRKVQSCRERCSCLEFCTIVHSDGTIAYFRTRD